MLTLAISLLSLVAPNTCTSLQCPGTGTACAAQLGPSAFNGENAKLDFDINAGTGNLFMSHTDVHLQPPIGPAIEFTRHYNSQGNGRNVGLGLNWTHSYSWSVSQVGGAVTLVTDVGQSVTFTQSGTTYTAQVGEFGTLTKNSSGFLYTTRAHLINA